MYSLRQIWFIVNFIFLFPIMTLGQVPQGYYTYSQIVGIADSLVQAFPAICKKQSLGVSPGGRQLFALKISDNAGTEEDQPEILFDGGIHGNEIGGPQNLIMYARDLCRKYSHDSFYTGLINTSQIWLYIMVNPDGYENMSRFNDAGVDLNRDFGYMWEDGGTSPYPFSQPESRVLRNFILDHRFAVYTNYHSGTEIIAYPWSYRPDPSRDNALMDSLAKTYSRFSGYQNLLYGQGFNVMYQVIGSTKDFVYGINGAVSWSMEISVNQQPPAPEISKYYNYNLPAMNEMARRAGWGIHGVVTDSLSGSPVSASIWIGNYYPVRTSPGLGNYYKYLNPGNYSVTVKANGYRTKTLTGISIPDSGSAIANFQLSQEPAFYASRLCSCQIPNFNFFDEGYTPGLIGAPDNVPYSIGHNGWVVLDMGDTIYDGPGNDLRVWQSGAAIKIFNCFGSITMDGPWTLIGNAMYTHDFDLQLSGMQKVRYIKITDGGTAPATGSGAGYNLDAIEMLTIPLRANIMAEVRNACQGSYIQFHDITQGTINGRQWSFPGGIPSSSLQKDPLILYPAAGRFDVSLAVSNSYCKSVKTDTGFVTIDPIPVVKLGNDTIVCTWASVLLDAGNPGSSYLWSTGDTTRTIVADTSGIGSGSRLIGVTVTSPFNCLSGDSITISFQPCPGIDEVQSSVFSIFPNPSDGHITCISDVPLDGRIAIFDSKGVLVFEMNCERLSQTFEIDISHLPPGLFLALWQRGDLVIKKRFILSR